MKIYNNKILKFNYFIPIYNWYYPLTNFKAIDLEENPNNVFKQLETSIVKSRAFYFHIPFCKSICTFCPFVRTQPQNFQVIEKYTQALIHEIELKVNLLDRVIGSEQMLRVHSLKHNEKLLLVVGTEKTGGTVTKILKDSVIIKLNPPICPAEDFIFAISRIINRRYRLIGYGETANNN